MRTDGSGTVRDVLLPMMCLAPTVAFLAISVERRLGAAAAGWVAALPVSLTVAVIGIGVESGPRAAAVLALSAVSHVAAQVTFAIAIVATVRRARVRHGLAAGAAAYVATSLALAGVPVLLAVAAGVPALIVAPRLVVRHSATTTGPHRSRPHIPILVTPFVVACAMVSSRVAGPAVAGAIAAFPAVTATLAVSLGRPAIARTFEGLVRSLPCYLTFGAVVAATVQRIPLAASVALALTATLCTAGLTWRRVPAVLQPA